MRIAHESRDRVECPSFLGLPADFEAQCGADAPELLVNMVDRSAAPMLKVKLHTRDNNDYAAFCPGLGVDFCQCAFWTIQIAEGPCEGYYLDQNESARESALDPPSPTQWRKTRDGFAL